jgi:hypothetical protein
MNRDGATIHFIVDLELRYAGVAGSDGDMNVDA